jgi:hypothetical protein
MSKLSYVIHLRCLQCIIPNVGSHDFVAFNQMDAHFKCLNFYAWVGATQEVVDGVWMAPKLYPQDKALNPNQGLGMGFVAHLAKWNHMCHNMGDGTLDQCLVRQWPT